MNTEIREVANNDKPPSNRLDNLTRCFLAISILRGEVRQFNHGCDSLSFVRGARLCRRYINL